MLLMNSERFALILAENLEVGSIQVVISDNICKFLSKILAIMSSMIICTVIAAELVDTDNISDITFPDPNIDFNTDNSIFIPASYIHERSMTTGKLYALT